MDFDISKCNDFLVGLRTKKMYSFNNYIIKIICTTDNMILFPDEEERDNNNEEIWPVTMFLLWLHCWNSRTRRRLRRRSRQRPFPRCRFVVVMTYEGFSLHLVANAIPQAVLLNGGSTLIQYSVVPLNGSKHYFKCTFNAIQVLETSMPGHLWSPLPQTQRRKRHLAWSIATSSKPQL